MTSAIFAARTSVSGNMRTCTVLSIVPSSSCVTMGRISSISSDLAITVTELVYSSTSTTGLSVPRREAYIASIFVLTDPASAFSSQKYSTSLAGRCGAFSRLSRSCSTSVKCPGVVETISVFVRSSAATVNVGAVIPVV